MMIHHLELAVSSGCGQRRVQKVRAGARTGLRDGLRAPWLTLWDEVSGVWSASATLAPRREDARHDC